MGNAGDRGALMASRSLMRGIQAVLYWTPISRRELEYPRAPSSLYQESTCPWRFRDILRNEPIVDNVHDNGRILRPIAVAVAAIGGKP